MDKYNVLDIADSLESLENDFIRWQTMTYDMRKDSDTVCLQRFGLTNIQLYNAQRANFIYYQDNKPKLQQEIAKIKMSDSNEEVVQKNLNDLPAGCTSTGVVNIQADKILATKQVNAEDDDVVLIPDWLQNDIPDYSHDILIKLYNDYTMAAQDHKEIADSHSLRIWHKTVPQMYNYMKSKFHKYENDSSKDPIPVDEAFIPEFIPDQSDQRINNFRDAIATESGDNLQLYIRKIDCYTKHESAYESRVLESYGDKITIGNKSYRADIPGVVPFLQYDEYVNNPYSLDMKKIVGGMFPYILSYDEKPRQRYQELDDAWKNKDSKKLLEMGWNPKVKPTKESIDYAREKQIKYLDEAYPIEMIDISDYSTNLSSEVLSEAVDNLPSNKSLKPIYLIVSCNKKVDVFSKISKRLFSDTEYSHIGVSFNSIMNEIYTFDTISDDGINKIRVDSIEDYKYDTSKFRIIAFFVRPEIYDKIKNGMKTYLQNQDNSIYHFDNVFSLIADKPKLKNKSMAFVCASFLDSMFKMANVYDKFAGMKNKNANIHFYILYTGNANGFKRNDIDKKVKALQKNMDFNKLSFFEPDLVIGEIQYKFIENFNIKTSDERINTILENIRSLLTPNDAAGNISTKDMESISEDIISSIKLLSTYGDSDIEGIKRECVKLLYNSYILKSYKKKNSTAPDIGLANQLLSSIDSNLDIYLKQIKILDPSWNLDKAICTSGFCDEVTIDRDLYRYDGSNLKG